MDHLFPILEAYSVALEELEFEIMKVRTIMASFFIPITFFASVYGMNFEHNPRTSMETLILCFLGCLPKNDNWTSHLLLTQGLDRHKIISTAPTVTFDSRNMLQV